MKEFKNNKNEKELLEGNFKKDPFREEKHYVLHVKHDEKKEAVEEAPQSPTPAAPPEAPEPPPKKEKRTLKNVLTDASRQIVASLIILVIGFFLLNWSAYYQIFENKWNNYFHPEQNDVLEEIVDTDSISSGGTQLETSSNPEIQKTQIPDLNLEVAPIDDRIIIPKINKNIPIVRVSSKNLITRDWNALEGDMQEALKGGVVHYPGTSLPGQQGNIVITGHSSYFPWDPGRFKDVFALLHEVQLEDDIVIYYDQDKFIYKVTEKYEVKPENIDVLLQTPADKLTLITCTPVGTNLRRLIVVAEAVE
jgi:LPXTG-site transpeptidase (sortase) family protein